MLKYKVWIRLYVPNCVLIWWVCVFIYNASSRHTTATCAWMVSPCTQYIKTQFDTNNFMNILYSNADFKLLFTT